MEKQSSYQKFHSTDFRTELRLNEYTLSLNRFKNKLNNFCQFIEIVFSNKIYKQLRERHLYEIII